MHGDLPRFKHSRIGDRYTGEFQSKVSLDRGINFRWAAVIDIPAAVGALHGEDVVDGLALPFLVDAAIPMMICDHVRNERGINHQFSDPITFRLLDGEKV